MVIMLYASPALLRRTSLSIADTSNRTAVTAKSSKSTHSGFPADLLSSSFDRRAPRRPARTRSRRRVEAATDPGLLDLRPHPRAARRTRPAGWHRPQLPEHPGRGNLLPHAEAQGIRRGRDVPLFLCDDVVPARPAVHRDSGVSVAILPAFLRLRARGERDKGAGGAGREGSRWSRGRDARHGVDAAHAFRRACVWC